MRIYNSLTRKVEDFVPLSDKGVGMYTCGPTVYSFVSIGNWRTYTLGDLLLRTLRQNGFQVDYIMNITDVGHLTGDNEGDADRGEDRLEKAARYEHKTAWQIAEYYTKDFLQGFEALNLTSPRRFTKATDYIQEQIDLVQKIEERGFAYQIGDGIYFDTQAFEKAGFQYGQLSNLDEIKAGARVEINPEKKDPHDFALWKFGRPGVKRDMEWESPWGVGFPGWHIECSAMSMKYLGPQFDLHVGGEDLRSTHHPNEIAQSEAATGKHPFVKYWVHGAFLTVGGKRMGKSLGNAYTLKDLAEKGFSPMALRYFYLTGHYRKVLNFTWEALASANQAFTKLYEAVSSYPVEGEVKPETLKPFRSQFMASLNDDLNMPQALAVAWSVIKSDLSEVQKRTLLLEFDQVMGLGLSQTRQKLEIMPEAQTLLDKRNRLRAEKRFEEADKIRQELLEMGYNINDTVGKSVLVKMGKK